MFNAAASCQRFFYDYKAAAVLDFTLPEARSYSASVELVVTLLVVGAILLLLETVLPGMVAGIVGGCCLLVGVIMAYVNFGVQTGTLIFGIVVVAVTAGFAVWARVFPQTRFGRKFISQGVIGDIRADQPELLHQTGTAYTQLRPSGTAVIHGKRVDVVTEGTLIEKGTAVKVVAIEGMRVVVRAMEGPVISEIQSTHS